MIRDTKNVWFKLFASCVIVKGVFSSLIYDVERGEFYDIPNDYLEILNLAKQYDIKALKEYYHNEQNDQIQSFLNHFVDQEIGFFTNEPDSFPDIDFTWYSPSVITNSIIEIDNLTEINYKNVIDEISSLLCNAVQIRFLNSFTHAELENIIQLFNETQINHIEILIPYSPAIVNNNLFDLVKLQPRLKRIMVYAFNEDRIIDSPDESLSKIIIYLKKNIQNDEEEIIKPERFGTNIHLFSEAQKHNIGLNRKVCIDKYGNIKNYLSHQAFFGNVKKDKIGDVILDSKFQEKWFIYNDMIEVCKDCQYRYACISNSDIKTENGKLYKHEMCRFDPNTNTWKES